MTEQLFAPDGKPDFSYRKCNTVEELAQYIKDLVEYPNHDYNTSGYSITKALLATEMLIAHLLGTTGAQHGFAQLAYLKETRHSELGIATIDFDNLMYPQYDVLGKVQGWIEDTLKGEPLKKMVKSKIETDDKEDFKSHPDVRAYWEKLVK